MLWALTLSSRGGLGTDSRRLGIFIPAPLAGRQPPSVYPHRRGRSFYTRDLDARKREIAGRPDPVPVEQTNAVKLRISL